MSRLLVASKVAFIGMTASWNNKIYRNNVLNQPVEVSIRGLVFIQLKFLRFEQSNPKSHEKNFTLVHSHRGFYEYF